MPRWWEENFELDHNLKDASVFDEILNSEMPVFNKIFGLPSSPPSKGYKRYHHYQGLREEKFGVLFNVQKAIDSKMLVPSDNPIQSLYLKTGSASDYYWGSAAVFIG